MIKAAYGGGFKPPHKGHFNVVKKAISEIENVSEFVIFIGKGVRDGIDQDDAYKIWEIYLKYLPNIVKIVKGLSPIKDVFDYSKENLDDTVYFVLGFREGNESDLKDIANRTKSVEEKYPNIKVKSITTGDNDISGTKSREISNNIESLKQVLPQELSEEDIQEIFNIMSPKHVSNMVNESFDVSDYKKHIAGLTEFVANRQNLSTYPKVKFIHNDEENAENFLGKTAYYNPNNQEIVLYTHGRDPIAIVSSFSHELIHYLQDLEGRLQGIDTENTQDSEYLEQIEREAYEGGGINLRAYKDSLRKQQELYENFVKEENTNFNQFEKELNYTPEPIGLDAGNPPQEPELRINSSSSKPKVYEYLDRFGLNNIAEELIEK